MRKKYTVVYWIMGIEIICIFTLSVFLFIFKRGILNRQKYSVYSIQKKHLIFPENSSLRFYYEATQSATILVHEDWLDHEIINTLNNEGLNDRYNYTITKPRNTYRIIALGDSFTYGQYVNTKDSWPEQFEDILNTSFVCSPRISFEVINFGMGGYDMQYELERFKRSGSKYKPDLVIWFLNGDRWNELMHEKIEERSKQLTEQDWKEARLYGDYYPAWTYAANYVNSAFSDRKKLEQYRVFMQEFSALYKDKLLILTLSEVDEAYKARLKSLVIERGMINTWFYSKLPKLSMGVNQLRDGHPNELWYKESAGLIADFLEKEHIIDCKR